MDITISYIEYDRYHNGTYRTEFIWSEFQRISTNIHRDKFSPWSALLEIKVKWGIDDNSK